jgi:hypothetical protein
VGAATRLPLSAFWQRDLHVCLCTEDPLCLYGCVPATSRQAWIEGGGPHIDDGESSSSSGFDSDSDSSASGSGDSSDSDASEDLENSDWVTLNSQSSAGAWDAASVFRFPVPPPSLSTPSRYFSSWSHHPRSLAHVAAPRFPRVIPCVVACACCSCWLPPHERARGGCVRQAR